MVVEISSRYKRKTEPASGLPVCGVAEQLGYRGHEAKRV
jgi:hypothetical protein